MMNNFHYLIYESKIYFELVTEDVGDDDWVMMNPSDIRYLHWYVSYDLEKKEWDLVASLPYPTYIQFLGFGDMQNRRLSLENENEGIVYIVDIDTGETAAIDCAEILDGMIVEGKLPKGTRITGIQPLRDYFSCYTGKDNVYCRISTREIVDSEEISRPGKGDLYPAGYSDKFTYNGELYVINYDPVLDRDVWLNVKTGESKPSDIKGTRMSFFSETENGLIFSYLNLIEDENGLRLEPETYVVKEGGREVTYWYPQKYVYVTKEDIMDGNIDEPWYYDAETYSFVRK